MKTIILDNITPLLEYVINQKIKPQKPQKEYQVYFDKRYEEYYVCTESLKDFDALTTSNLPYNQYKLIRKRLADEKLYDDNYIFLQPGPFGTLHWNKAEKENLDEKYSKTQHKIQITDFNYKYWKNTFM